MLDQFQILLPEIQVPLCAIHNLPGLVINPNKNDKQKPVFCIDCLTKLKKVEDQIKENQKRFQEIKSQNQGKIDLLNLFLQSINEFLKKITSEFNKIITMINDQINSFKYNQTQNYESFIQSKYIDIDTIIKRNDVQNQSFHEFIQQTQKQFIIIKQIFNFDNLIIGLQQNKQIQGIEEINKQFQYSKVIGSIQQNYKCYAIAFNSYNSNLAVANNNKIRIFELQNNKLNEIQQLEGHIKDIQCLTFMKKSQQLVSACFGGKIIIWEYSINNQWQQMHLLNEHQNSISCLQINQNEDLIISGSEDATIKFWNLNENQWKCNQTLQMENKVYCLSLNDSNNKLITKIKGKIYIGVFENNANQWCQIQTIQLSKNTNRICFINNNQFAVQLLQSDLLQIFNFDQKDTQFKLQQEIKVKYDESDYNLFPMQFIKSQDLLIDKNCQYINILRKNQNGEFALIQTIDNRHRSLYGCVSDDGSYLFTWDHNSKKIQIRKLQMI